MSVEEFNRIHQYRYAGTGTPDGVQVQVDYSVANTVYLGYAVRGKATTDTAWKIKKETFDGNGRLTSVAWSENAVTWSGRTGHPYA